MIEDGEVLDVFFKEEQDCAPHRSSDGVWFDSWHIAARVHIARMGCSPYGMVTTTFMSEIESKLVDLEARGLVKSVAVQNQNWRRFSLMHGLLDTLALVAK